MFITKAKRAISMWQHLFHTNRIVASAFQCMYTYACRVRPSAHATYSCLQSKVHGSTCMCTCDTCSAACSLIVISLLSLSILSICLSRFCRISSCFFSPDTCARVHACATCACMCNFVCFLAFDMCVNTSSKIQIAHETVIQWKRFQKPRQIQKRCLKTFYTKKNT